MSRRAAAILLALVTAAACSPSPGPTGPGRTTTPGATGGPDATTGPGATTAVVSGPAEPGVVKGRVTTADGQPIEGASIRIIGYTGTIGQHDDNLVTGPDGTYRIEIEDGLYELEAQATIAYGGETFILPLEPADGTCDEAESSQGIVEDFVLRLSGPRQCTTIGDDNAGRYFGAAAVVYQQLSGAASPDAVVEFTFTPDGPLVDGSEGEVLTMERTVSALSNHFGPLDGTATLYDIPIGRYTVSAELRDGTTTVPLLVQPDGASAPAREATLAFRGAQFFPYGPLDQQLTITDDGLG
jgi:hypothetical protein